MNTHPLPGWMREQRQGRRKRRPPVARLAAAAAIALAMCGPAQGQGLQSPFDGTTPTANSPGTPDTWYHLSNFDTVNVPNGHLSFVMPLVDIPGRGAAKTQVVLHFDTVWHVQAVPVVNTSRDQYCSGPPGTICSYGYVRYAEGWDSAYTSDYSLQNSGYTGGPLVGGIMIERQSGNGCAGSRWAYTLSRLTWARPDGSATEFVDVPTGGRPAGTVTNDRGSLFIATDGSSSIFQVTADGLHPTGTITESANGCPSGAPIPVSGTLTERDGTRYIFSGGTLTSIKDRNGNTLTATHTTGTDPANDQYPVVSVLDAYNRTTVVKGALRDCVGCQYYDEVDYPITSGTATTKVFYSSLGNAIRQNSAHGSLPVDTGLEPMSYFGLCTIIDCNTIFNPNGLVSQVLMPNGQSYRMCYDSGANLNRVVLPTGGVFEYDYRPVTDSFQVSSNPSLYLYNVRVALTEKRIFNLTPTQAATLQSSPCSNIWAVVSAPDQIIDYSVPGYDQTKGTYVTVTYKDGSGAVTGSENHYFVPTGAFPTGQYSLYSSWSEGRETRVEYYDSAANGGGLLKTDMMQWQQRPCSSDPVPGNAWCSWWSLSTDPNAGSSPLHDPRITTEYTTWNGIETGGKSYAYDGNNNRTGVTEYALANSTTSPGAAMRTTTTVFSSNSSYTGSFTQNGSVWSFSGPHILTLPTSETVYDQNSVQRAQTTWSSDQSSPTAADCSSPLQHDASYGTSFLARGNPTSVGRWWYDLVNGINTTLTTTQTFDILGNMNRVQDARNVRYDASYYDATNSCSLPTKITFYPTVAQTSPSYYKSLAWDYNARKISSVTDVNGNPTSFGYSDALERLTLVTRPTGGGTSHFTYTDTLPVSVKSEVDQNTVADKNMWSTVTYDGLGRKNQSVTHSADGDIYTCWGYDARGRVSWATNPVYGSACDVSSTNKTTTGYDGINRTTSVTAPDGSLTQYKYYADSASNTTQKLEIDPRSVNRVYSSDGLGRLVKVVEHATSWSGGSITDGFSGQATYTTNYAYDALDDLTLVCQGASIVSGSCQTGGLARQFAYDSLKRLVQATNPESGAIKYTYDQSGNLATRLDANSITTTSAFDGLNRITSKTYSGGSLSTPNVTYCYDNVPSGNLCQAPAAPFKGRLTYVVNSNSSTLFSNFDAMGRVLSSRQTTSNPTATQYNFSSYGYDLTGAIKSESYPSGRTLTTVYEAAGRPTTVTGYVQGAHYAPQGGIWQVQLGNGLYNETCYNPLLQPKAMRLGSASTLSGGVPTCADGGSDALNLTFTYGAAGADNGNLTAESITARAPKPSAPAMTLQAAQAFTYDQVNRISSSSETGAWSRNYGYDAFGNAWVTSYSGQALNSFTPQASSNFNAKNQLIIQGSTYDAAGNQSVIGAYANKYDAENRLVTANLNTVASTGYAYDGDGRRVMKLSCPVGTSVCALGVTGATVTTTYVYDAAGQLAAEYGVVPSSPCATCYLTDDHLGSTRAVTDGGGLVQSLHDYLPFGEEIRAGVGVRAAPYYPPSETAVNDGVTEKFTGKERDQETGLDYFGARYLSSAQGRWTSPDPIDAKRIQDPQRLNLYAYVRDNPLALVDPDGNEDQPAALVKLARELAASHPALMKVLDAAATGSFAKGLRIGMSDSKHDAAILMAEHPDLTEVNALNAVSAPFGYVVVSGRNVEGPDIHKFMPSPDTYVPDICVSMLEVKAITSLSNFGKELSEAAGQLNREYGSRGAMIQVPDGTSKEAVEGLLRGFRNVPGRDPRKYANIFLEVYNASGSLLYSGVLYPRGCYGQAQPRE